jgi:hypothetical protein
MVVPNMKSETHVLFACGVSARLAGCAGFFLTESVITGRFFFPLKEVFPAVSRRSAQWLAALNLLQTRIERGKPKTIGTLPRSTLLTWVNSGKRKVFSRRCSAAGS